MKDRARGLHVRRLDTPAEPAEAERRIDARRDVLAIDEDLQDRVGAEGHGAPTLQSCAERLS